MGNSTGHQHPKTAEKDADGQSIEEAKTVKARVKSLPKHLTEYFRMLAVFGDHVPISVNVVATVFGVDPVTAEGLMKDLISHSLVQEGSPLSKQSDCPHYIIQDPIRDYLHDSIPQRQQAALHSTVIRRYSEKCGGKFATLSPDGYVHRKLLSHVKAAGNRDLLGDLMSSLDWLTASILHGDPVAVLGDYRMYRDSVPQQFESKLRSFEAFLSGNMHVLPSMLHGDDVIQLALFQPSTSEVYRQAAGIASGDRNKRWLKWNNKIEESESSCVLTVKMHSDTVSHCQYSQDGSRVVSCSDDTTVKLWDSSTGKVLQEFKGHEDWVNCCALSRSGSLIISASTDQTVKVWDVHSKQLLVDFYHRHKASVLCCDISPDEKLVVSGSSNSTVIIWEARTKMTHAQWFIPICVSSPGHVAVSYCKFTPTGEHVLTGSGKGAIALWTLDGELVREYNGHSRSEIGCIVVSHDGKLMASASEDKTAKIWDLAGGSCVHTLAHSNEVYSCDFSLDDSQLVTGGGGDASVKIWSVRGGDLLQDLGVRSTTTCVCHSPSGQHILAADPYGIVKILRVEQQTLPEQYHHQFSVWFERVGVKYEAVVVCQNKKNEKLEVVHGSVSAAVVATLPTLEDRSPCSWQISNTGTMVAVGYENGTLQMVSLTRTEDSWEVKELWLREGVHCKCVKECYFSPDDSKIVSRTKTEHQSWDAATGKELAVIRADEECNSLCVFFNDSIRVVSARDQYILVWSSVTGNEDRLISCEDICEDSFISIKCIDLSQDNSRLAASISYQEEVVVWDTESWEIQLRVKQLSQDPICALSPDGSHAAIGSDSELQIWNISEGRKVEIASAISDTTSGISRIVFFPDGLEIITLCENRIDWWKIDGSHTKTVFLKASCHYELGDVHISPNYDIVAIDIRGVLYILTPFMD